MPNLYKSVIFFRGLHAYAYGGGDTKMDYVYIYFIGLLATTVGTLAGGGGLISFPSMLLLGVPVHSAIGANKVSNTVSSFTSFWHLYR